MPFKKLSRRTFPTVSSALAFPHTLFARTLSARQSVDTNDYNPHDWIASLEQAFSGGQTVVVPGGLVCDDINTGIFIPPGKMLHILGSLRGNGRGRFVLQDGSQVTGEENGSMHNTTLDVHGSDCTIEGLAMSGFGPVMQIYIGGKNKRVMRNLTIDNLTVSHANYAILHQGFHNQTIDANITNCKFNDLQGDAIEWNVAISDRDTSIFDHAIERINRTNDKINWGIGIGLARSTYDNNCPEDRTMKNFVTVNIVGPDCQQLIHAEDGEHPVIHDIKARNITPDFSKKVGIDNAIVAIYGCDNFVIDNTEMINSAGILIGYGIIKGKYLLIPQNFWVNNIQLDNTHLAYKLHGTQISVGDAVFFVALTNIEMRCASLELYNKPQHLLMCNINVMQEPSAGPVLSMNFDMCKDVRGVFMVKKETLLSLVNIRAMGEGGQSSIDIDRVNHHAVNVEKINLRLPERREQICDHSWKNGAILRSNAIATHNEAA